MQVVTKSMKSESARREAFDRILGNYLLNCTVCDNNNGNCTVHNTTKLLASRTSTNTLMPEMGDSPLPKGNHRFGHPTSQRGVEVERKWKRPDYWMPGTRQSVQTRTTSTDHQ
jgi:predicted molibdopterin-dependent oxidoreductase YjgC